MVTGRRKSIGQTFEDGLVIVKDLADLAVHQVGGWNDFPPKRLANGLVAQTDSQDRNPSGKVVDELQCHTGIVGNAGSGRNDNLLGLAGLYPRNINAVVAVNDDLFPQFSQILHQVVGKGVVVVDDQNHGID